MEKALKQFDSKPSSILIFNKCKQMTKKLPPHLNPEQFRRAFLGATLLLRHGKYRVFVRYHRTPTLYGGEYVVDEVEITDPDEMPYMARRIDLGTFDTREQGAEVVLNGPADLVERLNAYVDRGKASDRELARLSGQTIARFDADTTAPDPTIDAPYRVDPEGE